MNSSETLKELAEALAKAQGQMKPALKDANNPFFKSKYADLASVWDACREPLSENGLSVVQLTEGGPHEITVTTRLMHLSGEWMECSLTLQPKEVTPQAIGSAATYARRYSLMAMVGIAPEDDDGNAASHSAPTAPRTQPAKQAPPPAPVKQPEPAAVPDDAEECKALALEITRMINERLVTAEDVKTYGKLESISQALANRDVKGLSAAYFLLQELVAVKQKELSEAS